MSWGTGSQSRSLRSPFDTVVAVPSLTGFGSTLSPRKPIPVRPSPARPLFFKKLRRLCFIDFIIFHSFIPAILLLSTLTILKRGIIVFTHEICFLLAYLFVAVSFLLL